MTAAQTLHLIEQFAAQAPFAVWITDSRGVAIFANKKVHEIFGIDEHPSGALGMNLFDDPAVEALGLTKLGVRARAGELLDEIINIRGHEISETNIKGATTKPMVIRVVVYPLLSASQKIEHHVIIITDVTSIYSKREKMQKQNRELEIYMVSKEARKRRCKELEERVALLEKEIRSRGKEPIQ